MADRQMDAEIVVQFDEAASRQSLNSGDNLPTLFSKVKKFFSDLKTVAFSGSYNDLSDIPESLPANGGNADTVGGLHVNEIASNPNLLINPDFRVNQRGLSEYNTSNDSYAVDRWLQQSKGGNVSIIDGKIHLESPTRGNDDQPNYANLIQIINLNEYPFLYGKTVTLSCKLTSVAGNVALRCAQGYNYGSGFIKDIRTQVNGDDITTLTFDIEDNQTYPYLCFILCMDQVVYPSSFTAEWVKLELGLIATPFVPPDPATELVKCQRYYQIHSSGDINPVDLRPNMRITPTITQLSDGNYAYDAEIY